MQKKTLFNIIDLLQPYKRAFASIAVFSGVINLLMLAPMFYMMWLYDRVLTSKNEITLLALTGILVFFYAIWWALESTRSYVVIHISKHLDARLNEQVYDAAFQKALKQQQGVNAVQSLNDLMTLRQFVTGTLLFALLDLPWFPVFLLILYMFNFWMGSFALLSVIVMVGLSAYNEILTRVHLTKANNLAMRSTNTAGNTLKNSDVLDAMGMLSAMKNKWLSLHEKFLEHQTIASKRAATVGTATKVFQMVVQSLIMGLGALLVLEGKVSIGMIFAGSFVMGKALMPIQVIVQSWPQVSSAMISYKRLSQLINQNPSREYAMTLPAPKGRIQIEHIYAAPPGCKNPIIHNVNFNIEPGDVLAIAGPSASGKSTLAKCMIGVWHPLSGKVRLDAANMHTWNRDELGPYLGYLPQDIEIFEGSISQNIARFAEFDPADVVNAAIDAGIHEMILKMSDGYETQVGPGGLGLSGGQMQRLGLARALYKNPVFVVLDEPNSNLDDSGERSLNNALLKLRERKSTVVVVTHRMSVLNMTNKMLVMRDGQVSNFGPTKQVLEELSHLNQPKQVPANSSVA